MTQGSLVVVGTGISLARQATPEAVAAIRRAERVLFLTADPVCESWIRGLAPTAESLAGCYGPGKPRRDTYDEMVQRILAPTRAGLEVCAAFYGHPGVLVRPSHEAIRVAREEGYRAVMLPGVSAEDCLFADLGVDPALRGCQSFDATDFLLHRRRFDPTSSLILWQIPVVGILDATEIDGERSLRGLRLLRNELQKSYPRDHEVVIYEADQFSIHGPMIQRLPLHALPEGLISPISTLYVPPLAARAPDRELLERFGITVDQLIEGPEN